MEKLDRAREDGRDLTSSQGEVETTTPESETGRAVESAFDVPGRRGAAARRTRGSRGVVDASRGRAVSRTQVGREGGRWRRSGAPVGRSTTNAARRGNRSRIRTRMKSTATNVRDSRGFCLRRSSSPASGLVGARASRISSRSKRLHVPAMNALWCAFHWRSRERAVWRRRSLVPRDGRRLCRPEVGAAGSRAATRLTSKRLIQWPGEGVVDDRLLRSCVDQILGALAMRGTPISARPFALVRHAKRMRARLPRGRAVRDAARARGNGPAPKLPVDGGERRPRTPPRRPSSASPGGSAAHAAAASVQSPRGPDATAARTIWTIWTWTRATGRGTILAVAVILKARRRRRWAGFAPAFANSTTRVPTTRSPSPERIGGARSAWGSGDDGTLVARLPRLAPMRVLHGEGLVSSRSSAPLCSKARAPRRSALRERRARARALGSILSARDPSARVDLVDM